MSYQMNDMFTVALDGFVAPVGAKDEARGNDQGKGGDARYDYNDYNDYKHELEFQLHTRFAEDKKLVTSFYNEYSSQEGFNDTDSAETKRNEWQLRLVYSQDFGDFSVSPFARITLSREVENTVNQTKDELRNRYGVAGTYSMTNEVDLIGEVYYQSEDQRTWENKDATSGDRNYMFYKVAVRYNF